jgi:maleate isomerase
MTTTWSSDCLRSPTACPVVTTGQALLAALAHLGARRVMLVDPPWFPADLTQRGTDWLKRNGVEASDAQAVDIPSGQATVHPGSLYRWLRSSIAPGTDAVLIGGNGFRAVGVVRAIEADTGVPVVTANTALLWQTLRTLGIATDSVTRYGRLFSERPAN